RRSSPGRGTRPARPPRRPRPSPGPTRSPARAPPRASGAGSRRACGEYTGGLPTFRQDLLKQREGARIVGLTQPEQGLLAHSWTGVGAGDADQRRHALVTRLLGQREHGAFLYLERHRGVVQQFRETARRRLPAAWPSQNTAERRVSRATVAVRARRSRSGQTVTLSAR